MDIRQSPQWGDYLSKISWTIERVNKTQIFIRRIPILNFSVIKIQRADNPLPLQKIDSIAKKYNAVFVLIEPQLLNFDKTELTKKGYLTSTMIMAHTATSIIHIDKSLPNILRSFSENARRNIKKAQKEKLKVKIISPDNLTDEDFQRFLNLLDNLVKIKKFFIPSKLEFWKKFNSFKKDSWLFFTYQDNIPTAAVWCAKFDQTFYYIQTGITDIGYKTMANYLLVWEAVKVAYKLNLKRFDFEGIYDPRFPKEHPNWKKFTEFKGRFHGEELYYPPSLIKIYKWWFYPIFICSKILPS